MQNQVFRKRFGFRFAIILLIVLVVIAAGMFIHSRNSTRVPIVLYHHFTEQDGKGDAMSAEHFRAHMKAIAEAGYTAVTFEDLRAYVEQGIALPEKPVVITFDDGYASNLLIAAPILREFGLNATVFAIGISAGKDTYKDTGHPMTPHFSLEDAKTCSDVIHVESHGYNLHEVSGLDPDPIRPGATQRPGESKEAYALFLQEDCQTMISLFQSAYGRKPTVFAYPYGRYSRESEAILEENGIDITLTIEPRINTLTIGQKDCLRLLGRFYVYDETTAEELLAFLKKA